MDFREEVWKRLLENYDFWSEIGSAFGEPGGTPHQKFQVSPRINLHFILTSSAAKRVNTYTVAIWREAWDLSGSVFIIDFRVASFFLVGGGRRISEGVKGTKPATSIRPKLTAACWHEHVNTTHVSMWTSCSHVARLFGNSWSTSPSFTGKPFSCTSWTQAWSSVSLTTSSSDL